MTAKYYSGAPELCDTCSKPLVKLMYDAKTVMGPWGNICSMCFKQYGTGLGTGKGQKYEKQDDGRWLKTGG
jgi:hypothetical protein